MLTLMGNTLIHEEYHLLGFLPLKSYFDNKKQVGPGKKCPVDKEDHIRCLIQKDALEQIKCTYTELKDVDKVTFDAVHQEI